VISVFSALTKSPDGEVSSVASSCASCTTGDCGGCGIA
jgi:hypothetical protein